MMMADDAGDGHDNGAGCDGGSDGDGLGQYEVGVGC